MKRVAIAATVVAFAFHAHAADAPAAPAPLDKSLTIVLPTSQWNTIINAVGNLPYSIAAPLIAEMQKQAAPQLDPPLPPSVTAAPLPKKEPKK